MVRILSDADVAAVLDLEALLPVVAEAFRMQGRGAVERPERPHFPVGTGLDSDAPGRSIGTALTMPAYIHGADQYATKLVSVHPDNPNRGLPTVNAQIALTAATTGLPAAFMAGTRITNARTAAVGGLAARELAAGPIRLGLLGAGTQARWQARAIAAAADLEHVRVYSPSDSRYDCAADLADELEVSAEAVDTPETAVADATVVVTATTSAKPVFPGEALAPGTLVVGVGAYSADQQEIDPETSARAASVFADVPAEVAEIGGVIGAALDEDDLVPFSAVLSGDAGRTSVEEILVVESVGSAVLDATTAAHVFDVADRDGVGTTVNL